MHLSLGLHDVHKGKWVLFANPPISKRLDEVLCHQNMCYDDLIRGKALNPLTINPLKRGTFKAMMLETGRAGTQYKTRRFIQSDEAQLLKKISQSITV